MRRARVEGAAYNIDHVDLSKLINGITTFACDFNNRSPARDMGRRTAECGSNRAPGRDIQPRCQQRRPRTFETRKYCSCIIDLTLSTRVMRIVVS